MRDIGIDGGALLTEAIQWYDGLLLAPAHFEQMALRQEELVGYQVRTAAPYTWGVRRLAIAAEQLAGGTFALTELEAILPDGLAVALSAKDGKLELTLNDAQRADIRDRNLRSTVYLAVASADQGAAQRYRPVDAGDRAGAPADPSALDIRRVRPLLRLVLENDLAHGSMVAIPLAVLKFEKEQFCLDAYLPPLLDIAVKPLDGGDSLEQQAGELRGRLRVSAAQLATELANAGADRHGEHKAELRERLRSVSAGLPLLTGMLSLTGVSPLTLYLTLCTMLGSLTMLRDPGVAAPEHPGYQHTKLGITFADLFSQIRLLLDTVERNYTEQCFERRAFLGSDAYQLQLEPDWLHGWPAGAEGGAAALVVGLRGLTTAEASQWMDSAAIASEQPLMRVRALRTLGALRSLVGSDGVLMPLAGRAADAHGHGGPRRLDVRALRAEDTTLFAIDLDSALIAAGQPLVLEWAGQPRPREVVLFVPKAAGGRAP